MCNLFTQITAAVRTGLMGALALQPEEAFTRDLFPKAPQPNAAVPLLPTVGSTPLLQCFRALWG